MTPAYSAIEHLARSLWLSRFKWSNRMAMYSAYFDESGHPDKGSYLIVAGCVADVEQWVEFEREWKMALNPLGAGVFHAVDFDSGKPPFDRLSAEEADELFDRLVGIVCRRIEKSVSQAIPLDQYRAINKRYVFAECYGFPYPAAARSCMAEIEGWALKHSIPPQEIRYFFEDGAKHKGQIEWIAERDRLPIPTFLSKNQDVPLQAGDLIAWCHNLYLTMRGRGQVRKRYIRALDTLARVSNEWGIVDLRDPDRIPTILDIPRRDPRFKYRFRVITKGGRRRAVVHYWPNEKIEPKLERKSFVLPEPSRLLPEEVERRKREYEAKTAGTV